MPLINLQEFWILKMTKNKMRKIIKQCLTENNGIDFYKLVERLNTGDDFGYTLGSVIEVCKEVREGSTLGPDLTR